MRQELNGQVYFKAFGGHLIPEFLTRSGVSLQAAAAEFDIDLLNAKYLQRHQDSLLGPLHRHFDRRSG